MKDDAGGVNYGTEPVVLEFMGFRPYTLSYFSIPGAILAGLHGFTNRIENPGDHALTEWMGNVLGKFDRLQKIVDSRNFPQFILIHGIN
jgi:hypothetical protein